MNSIRVAYSINSSGNTYGFHIGTYDPRHELVIDPLLSSTFLGGSGTDHGRCIARGPSGDIYIAGKTQSIDFPVTTNGYDTTYNDEGLQADLSYWDIFVARLDSELSMLKSCTYIGGDNQDIPYALTLHLMDQPT